MDQSKRENDKGAAKDVKDKYEEKMKKKGNKAKKKDNSKGSQYYYATVEDIANPLKGVPYDAIKGAKDFGLGFSGNNHRFKTLGHDPALGYLFGTCNILTNTLSTGKENKFATYHVKNSKIVKNADMVKMFSYSVDRFKDSRMTVGMALFKQFVHIKSDELSKKGINLPGFQLLFDSDKLENLTGKLDYAQLRTVTDQIAMAAMINMIISLLHQLYMFIEERNPNTKKYESKYDDLINPSDVKKIRTKKVIMISNSIATSVNLVATGALAAAGVATGNEKAVENAKKYFDLGGLIVTVFTLFKDIRFITKIKKEFIEKALDKNFAEKLQSLNETTDLDLLTVSEAFPALDAYSNITRKTVPQDEMSISSQSEENDSHNAEYSDLKLADAYFNGSDGHKEDKVRAFVLYKELADQGIAEAQYNLGWCYYHGSGVRKSYNQALMWYKRAAEQGNVSAQYELAEMYFKGEGTEVNIKKALEWQKKAAENGSLVSQMNLGYYYFDGTQTVPDYEEAKKWFEIALETAKTESDSESEQEITEKLETVGRILSYGE